MLLEREDINPQTFLPSSRSVAFCKTAWEAVGGYPEWLDYSEDLVFDMALKEDVGNFAFAPGPSPTFVRVAACARSANNITTTHAATAKPTCGLNVTPSATPPTSSRCRCYCARSGVANWSAGWACWSVSSLIRGVRQYDYGIKRMVGVLQRVHAHLR